MQQKKFDFSLYLVTDRTLSHPRDIVDIVRLAIEGGVTAVQVREKNIPSREFIEICLKIKSLLFEKKIPLIVNDRVDVALAVDADGVHLGQNDMPSNVARAILGKKKIIGLSVENLEQAIYADKNYDVDYLGVSPIFSTLTKTDLEGSWGIEGLKELRKQTNKKLIGIGGITKENAQSVIEAGADGIAVVSAICAAENPKQAALELRNIIDKFYDKT